MYKPSAITVRHEGRDLSSKVEVSLLSDKVLRSDSGAWYELPMSDKDFRLWYKIERIGFGRLPDRP
jgi:hypothetical protein